MVIALRPGGPPLRIVRRQAILLRVWAPSPRAEAPASRLVLLMRQVTRAIMQGVVVLLVLLLLMLRRPGALQMGELPRAAADEPEAPALRRAPPPTSAAGALRSGREAARPAPERDPQVSVERTSTRLGARRRSPRPPRAPWRPASTRASTPSTSSWTRRTAAAARCADLEPPPLLVPLRWYLLGFGPSAQGEVRMLTAVPRPAARPLASLAPAPLRPPRCSAPRGKWRHPSAWAVTAAARRRQESSGAQRAGDAAAAKSAPSRPCHAPVRA